MAILVILGLIVLWGAVLLPPILRSRNSSSLGGVSNFMDSLRSLGRGHGGARGPALGGPVLHGPVGGVPLGSSTRPGVGQPYANPYGAPLGRPVGGGPLGGPVAGAMTPMQRRRRNVLFGLAGAASLFFLVALVTGAGLVWVLFLLSAAALGGYVYLLLQFKKGALAVASAPLPAARPYVPPAADDEARVGDNVIVLRRNVG